MADGISKMIQSRDHFPIWLTENGLTGIGVEVGVYYGQNAEHILKNWPGVKLYGVDPYINYPKEEYLDGCNLVKLEEAMAHALEIVKPFGEKFKLLRMPSIEAITEFEDDSCDFVYLDGNHDYEHVIQDINAWYEKVKIGGVLGGHDYYEREDAQQRCHVPAAVKAWCRESDYEPTITPDTSWWIIKT